MDRDWWNSRRTVRLELGVSIRATGLLRLIRTQPSLASLPPELCLRPAASRHPSRGGQPAIAEAARRPRTIPGDRQIRVEEWIAGAVRRHHPPVSGLSSVSTTSPPPSATTSSHEEIKAQPSVDMRIRQTGSLALGDPSYHDLRLARIAGSHHCQPKGYCGVPRLEPECRLLGTANAGATVSVVKPGGGGCFLATGQASSFSVSVHPPVP